MSVSDAHKFVSYSFYERAKFSNVFYMTIKSKLAKLFSFATDTFLHMPVLLIQMRVRNVFKYDSD